MDAMPQCAPGSELGSACAAPTDYGHHRGLWTPTDTPPTACTVKSMMSETRSDALASQYAFLIVEALAQDGLSR